MRVGRAARGQSSGGLTGRALVLGVVVVLLALVLASPLQRFLQARASASQTEQENIATSARVAQLQKQMDLWNDPAYVEQQARARLQYARPGDTVYVVIDPGRSTANASAQQTTPVTTDQSQAGWQAKAWTSLQVADAP